MLKRKITSELIYLLKVVVVLAVWNVVVFLVSQILGGVLAEKEAEMLVTQETVSKAALELIGMQQLSQFPAIIEVFFLSSLISNIVVLGSIVLHSVKMMRKSIGQGSFGFLFMQVVKKHHYFISESIRVFGVACLTWLSHIGMMFVTGILILKTVETDITEKICDVFTKMSLWGLAIVFLLVAISVLYGISQSGNMHELDFSIVVMSLPFILGNVYKVPQYIGQMQVEAMVNAQGTMEVVRMMKQFRFFCPFSWLNPFNIYNHVTDVGMIWCYIGVAAVIFVVAGVVFCKRDWWEV